MVFGMMMQMMDMMPTVAMLVGSTSVAVGWVVHLGISMLFGVAFGAALNTSIDAYGSALGLGLGYGMALWVVGALVLMPARLGMPLFHLDTMAWQSLMGHAVFGMVLGAVFIAIQRRATR